MSSLVTLSLCATWMQIAFTQRCVNNVGIIRYDGHQCAYQCMNDLLFADVNDITSYPLSSVSFDELKAGCPHMQMAIDHYGSESCSSLSDLVWPSNSPPYCDCPYCACSAPQPTEPIIEYHEVQYSFTKVCDTCECSVINNDGDFGWECESNIYSVSNPYEWNHFTCDAEVSCPSLDPSDPSVYAPGDAWFENIRYDASCQTFCYCEYDGTTYCETSYQDIVNSSHVGLRAAFFDSDHCGETVGCANDASLLETDPLQSSCLCPLCTCPEWQQSGYIEYIEFTETGVINSGSNANPFLNANIPDTGHTTYCMECECSAMPKYRFYRNCSRDEDTISYAPGTETCPPTPVGTCLSGSAVGSDVIRPSGLSLVDCFGDATYCGWSAHGFLAGENDQEIKYNWGCQSRTFCDAFELTEGPCVAYVEDRAPVYSALYSCLSDHLYKQVAGLLYEEETQLTRHAFGMCCSGATCNQRDIDLKTCEHHTAVSEWFEDYLQCVYGDESPYTKWMCPTNDAVTCDDLKWIGKWWFGCDCAMFSHQYTRSDAHGRDFITQEMAEVLTGLDEWLALLDCTLSFECDLSTGYLHTRGPCKRPGGCDDEIFFSDFVKKKKNVWFVIAFGCLFLASAAAVWWLYIVRQRRYRAVNTQTDTDVETDPEPPSYDEAR